MKYFGILITILIIALSSCDGDPVEIITVDLSKNQIDLLFVSESEGLPLVYAVFDTTFDPIINVVTGTLFGQYGAIDPTWSHDGRKFAYVNLQLVQSGVITHSNIYIRNMDSTRTFDSAIRRVTFSPLIIDTLGNIYTTLNLRPDWHQESNRMVYISNRDSIFKIFITSISDSLTGDTIPFALTDASNPIDINCYPSFSPDGSKILYTQKNGNAEEIWIMNFDGSGKMPLVQNGASINARPRFSPSGDKISFYSTLWRNGIDSVQIYTINPDGSGLDTLTTSGFNYDPAWSPDGQQIVYAVRTLSGKGYIYIMNRDGTQSRRLIDNNRAYYPIWRP